MIDHKNVSPLLDGFSLGNPVGDHFGTCCYPAIKEDSDRKYIVKIISIPAAPSQLDALLITGAYKDAGEAAEYFRAQAEQTLQEAALLEQLSRENGFVAFEGSQMEPMEKGRIGYDVFFLSGFRLSLNRYMHRKSISHLDAVNLGIDICESLAAARRAGMLYIALKPANIFITSKKEFRIGDLGFVPLDSLRFTAMPEKYRSPYTAPELLDDLKTLNTTADTYSLGMILYQLFNNGLLPQDLTVPLPDPAAADPEMAQILRRACSPNVDERWEDPEQMGQALRAYLQAGTVNDTPILAPLPGRAPDQTVRLFNIQAAAEEARQAAAQEAAEEAPEQPAPVETAAPETAAADSDEPSQEDTSLEPAQEETAPADTAPAEEASGEAVPSEVPVIEPVLPDILPEAESDVPPEEPPAADPIEEELQAAAEAQFSSLQKQADSEEQERIDSSLLESDLQELNEILKPEPRKKKKAKKAPNLTPVVIKPKKKRHVVRTLVILLLLALLAAAGVWGYMFYTTEYLQPVRGISVEGSNSRMTVTVDSDITDGLLTAVCTDAYGHSQQQTVRNGKAEFTDLSPDALYKIQLEITGFRKLTGTTTEIFTTDSVTSVASFSIAMGSVDGTVILNLTTEGHEPNQWQVIYTAEGEPELGHTFSGHTTTISNLVTGKTYTFTLQTGDHKEVSGQTSVVFTPAPIVKAQNLSILSCRDGVMEVVWEAPADAAAAGWRIRCSGAGYEQTVETDDLRASFTGIDPGTSYTVECAALGMTQSVSVNVSANPITLTDFKVTENDTETMTVSWSYDGTAPADGWILQYTLDDGYLPTAVRCTEPTAVVESRIPGTVYHFTVLTSGSTSVFNGIHAYETSPAVNYNGHGMLANSISCKALLKTPETDGWTYESTVRLGIPSTTEFSLGDSISAALYSSSNFYLGNAGADMIHVMYVFRDENGNVLTELIGETTEDWYYLWFDEDYHCCELDVPTTPVKPGSYSLSIYFNGMLAASADLTVR